MSSNVTSPSGNKNKSSHANASPSSKGKAKAKVDHPMDEDEEEEEEEEQGGSDEEEDDDEDEDALEEIDPSVILPQGRRTRGVRVDYTSKEALAKAGFKGKEELEEDDTEDDHDVQMKD
ncbi:uncharacterized protein LACBIDRAFT_293231 [Laccaria bicolor S238N-H82]|uniref:Histone H2A.Z-specific chaperone CHZ1 n=1 Tax=Laccaria bicolor (strain S238N-H82 / ATCC MYA-4686) TaxID=486041 RepID=CHZ1_LACBS|nr:uncharacterized protein LACBIDRAFT_293231 [Laccaria bicolor S238N-H82]B0D1Q8.1 RecName: Full=Histone H2A.Z-specific chaperone CHZ1 [Laccaria bicolor S238N-H82]EDR11682.1 predicted protein [Laccaria bicolor S238N-H82]|eukprot:XP_001877579.1 predicted protein [Laccaria bicolor S238N-H82]